ncbi:MAG: glycosidase [Actinomycetota bacterium]
MFNPGAHLIDGTVHLLYRGIAAGDERYLSQLGYARSEDGFHFERVLDRPVLEPKEPYDKWAIEDPRIVAIDGQIYVTYVAIDVPALTPSKLSYTALATTKDFLTFERLGVITPRSDIDDRDTVLFPAKFGNNYAMLHRPQEVQPDRSYQEWATGSPSSIWFALSPSLTDWERGSPLMKPEQPWEAKKVGIGPPPLETEAGWLLIYHGVDEYNVYRTGLALLDLEDPANMIRRLPYSVLEPEEPYETAGDIPNVVFPCGAVIKEGRLFVYYGGADMVCAVATADLDEVLDDLLKSG